MQTFSTLQKGKGKVIGFVPTMGALHLGHLSLVKTARKQADFVVVSIFVNPIQFGEAEDFSKYPRDLKGDLKLLRPLGIDVLFYPKAEEMFKEGFLTYVEVKGLSDILCGKSRPGHFRGVTTIVAKLFQIVKPDIAYFGLKDYQQQVIIKKMVSDLNMNVKIISLPIVRERDGLAMSSRNTYLGKKERETATVLYKSLLLGAHLIRKGERTSSIIISKMRRLIRRASNVKIDYIAICDPENLQELKRVKRKTLIAIAAYVGKTRLIDNMVVKT